MKRKGLLVLVLLLVLAACLCLTACGKEGGRTGYVYVAKYSDLDANLENVYNSYFDGKDMLIAIDHGVVGKRELTQEEIARYLEWGYEEKDFEELGFYDVYGYKLSKFSISSGELTALENYDPYYGESAELAGSNSSMDISTMAFDSEGNIWLLENHYVYHYDANGDWLGDDQYLYLTKISSADGSVLLKTSLASLVEDMEWFYVNGFAIDSNGRIVLGLNGEKLFLMNDQAEVTAELPVIDYFDSLVKLGDGNLYASMWGESGYELKQLDTTSGNFSSTGIILPNNVYNVFPGNDEYLLFYSSGSDFYALSSANKQAELLFNYIDCDINQSMVQATMPISKEKIMLLNRAYDYNTYETQVDLITLTRTPASEVKEKTIITLATIYLDYDLRNRIIDFNKTNPDYRIKVTEYEQYSTGENWNAGADKLNTEIISGNVPDIIIANRQLPIERYAAKGLLEDLWTYIEKDKKLGGRDSMVTSALDAFSIDGKLYYTVSSYSIQSIAAATDVVGSEMGWTVDDMTAILAAHPESTAFAYATQTDILYTLVYNNINQYVDWNTGECYFDTEDFVQVLELAKTFPTELDWDEMAETGYDDSELIKSGKVLFNNVYISDFYSLNYQKELFGRDVTFIGYPSTDGVGNFVSSNDNGLAMSSSSKHKDVVWEFIRFAFTSEYQTSGYAYGWPTNQDAFDAMIDAALNAETGSDPNGDIITYEDEDVAETEATSAVRDIAISYPGGYYGARVTQQEVDRLLELIDSVSGASGYNSALQEIIAAEAAAFFAGDKTATETAKLIQSKISLYVNEQR